MDAHGPVGSAVDARGVSGAGRWPGRGETTPAQTSSGCSALLLRMHVDMHVGVRAWHAAALIALEHAELGQDLGIPSWTRLTSRPTHRASSLTAKVPCPGKAVTRAPQRSVSRPRTAPGLAKFSVSP